MTKLRLATASDAAPDPRWIKSCDDLAADLKTRANGFIGCSFDLDGGLSLLLAGDIEPDSAAGFLARCLASLANGDGDDS